MMTECSNCKKIYDDAVCYTFCPHDRFMSDRDLKQKDDALALIGKKLCFAHQLEGPTHRVRSIGWNGMITLDDIEGEFAPHLFASTSL